MTGEFKLDRKAQEENGRKLRENLRKTVAAGPKPGIFGAIGFNFSRNLLNDLENRNVQKTGGVKRRS